MTRYLYSSAFLLMTLFINGAAQNESSAPVVWERYRISDRQLSIEFPKMPVAIGAPGNCSEVEKTSYYAYAGEAVYELTVAAKSKQKLSQSCKKKKLFNAGLLSERLGEIRATGDMSEASGIEDGRQVYRFSGKTGTRMVISDIKNGRWLELAIVRREDVEAKDQRFFGSLKFSGDRGKEIGIGSDITLGDEGVKITPAPETVNDASKDRAVIVTKPRAMYTEEARKTGTSGTVSLRVTLLSNGGIGDIKVVKALPLGLTENAIAAAKKIVFLPVRVNGEPVNNTLIIQYSFSVY